MLEQLSAEVQSRLRSGVAVTSVAQCVEELVLNSIDANATCVAIRVDLSCCKVQVVDNGIGLTKDSLGKVAERYTTSKCHTLKDLDEKLQHFGYRGEALASIRDISSILEIESRSKYSTLSFTRLFQHGKPHPVLESKSHRPSAGTTITIHDLFHKLPVRKKSLNESLELEKVRQRVEAIALIHPSCSFSLRNDVTGTKVLQTHKSNSVLGAFTFLFGGAKSRLMAPVTAEAGVFKVNGFIGKEGNHNKSLQFIFINDRLVLKTKIHKLINYHLSKSSVTRRRYGGGEGSPNVVQSTSNGSPPRPMSERHGIFVINLTCPLSDYDITYDPSKTLIEFKDWRVVLKLVGEMTESFLIEQNLIMKIDPKGDDDVGSLPKELEAVLDTDSQEEGSGDCGPRASLQKYAAGITTANTSNNLVSEMVCRPKAYNPDEIVDQIIAEKTGEEKSKMQASESSQVSSEDIPGETLHKAASEKPISPLTSEHEKSHTEHQEKLSPRNMELKELNTPQQDTDTLLNIEPGSTSQTTDNTLESKTKHLTCGRVNIENTLSLRWSSEDSDELTLSNKSNANRVRDKTFISLEGMLETPEVKSNVQINSLTGAVAKLKQRMQSHLSQSSGDKQGSNTMPMNCSLQEFRKRIHEESQKRVSTELPRNQVTDTASEEVKDDASSDATQTNKIITLDPQTSLESCLSLFSKEMDPRKFIKAPRKVHTDNDNATNEEDIEEEPEDPLSGITDENNLLSSKNKQEGTPVIKGTVSIPETPQQQVKTLTSRIGDKDRNIINSPEEKEQDNILRDFSRMRNKLVNKSKLPLEHSDKCSKTNDKGVISKEKEMDSPEIGSTRKRKHDNTNIVLAKKSTIRTQDKIPPIVNENIGQENFSVKRLAVCKHNMQAKEAGDKLDRLSDTALSSAKEHSSDNLTDQQVKALPASYSAVTGRNPISMSSVSGLSENQKSTKCTEVMSSCSRTHKSRVTVVDSSMTRNSTVLANKHSHSTSEVIDKISNENSKKISHDLIQERESCSKMEEASSSKVCSREIDAVANRTAVAVAQSSAMRKSLPKESKSTKPESKNQILKNDDSLSELNERLSGNEKSCRNEKVIPSLPEINRKRQSENKLPLAAKLSRLSRGETVHTSLPSKASADVGRFSIIGHILETTQEALIKARSSATGTPKNTEEPQLKQTIEQIQISQPPPELLSEPETQPQTGLKEKDATVELDNKTTPDSVCCEKPLPCTKLQSPNKTDVPTCLQTFKKISEKETQEIEDLGETYKAKLFEKAFTVRATPKISTWTKKTNIPWLLPHELESETENMSSRDIDIMDKYKYTQQEEGGKCGNMLDTNKCLESNYEMTGSKDTPTISTVSISNTNKVDEDGNESPPALREAIDDVEDNEFPIERTTPPNISESKPLLGDHTSAEAADKGCKTESDPSKENESESSVQIEKQNSELITIQALDYTIEMEPIHKMNVPNIDLGGSPSAEESPSVNVCNITPHQYTDSNSGTPASDGNRTAIIEPSQGFHNPLENVLDTTNTISQDFAVGCESQGYVVKDETQSFDPQEEPSLVQTDKPEKRTMPLQVPEDDSATEKENEPKLDSDTENVPQKTLFVGPSWICKLDPNTGRKVFVNKITGHSSYTSPNRKADESAVISIKNPVLPAGATPLLQADSSPLQARPKWLRTGQSSADTEGASKDYSGDSHLSAALSDHIEKQMQAEAGERKVKWRDGSSPKCDDSEEGISVKTMLQEWENPVFTNVEQCGLRIEASSSNKGASRVQQAIHPYKFTKDVLSNVKVLGQMDNKFITCLIDLPSSGTDNDHKMLTVIDQHAAHERVRLERLTSENYSEDGSCISRIHIDPPMTVILKEEEVRVACAYRSALEKKGISLRRDTNKRTAVEVFRVPTCLVERDTSERKRQKSSVNLESLIREETELLNTTNGACTTIPQAVFRALCSQACHGAIKFGDALSMSECENLVKELSLCKLPFQCAHGRPSVMPILDLNHLNLHKVQEPKIRLWKLRQLQE